MGKFIKNVVYVLLFVVVIGVFFILLMKPHEVAGYFDPIVYYSHTEYIQTGKKKCKKVEAGNQKGKLVKVGCGVFATKQLARMSWIPAY